MKSFLKSASIIFVLAIVASFIADRRPEQASQLGLVILLISLFALLKPLPQIQLGHRGFSAAVALFVGFPMAVIGTADNTSQQDRNAVEAVSTKIASENTEAGSENEAPAAAASAPTDVARLEPVAEDEAESDHTSAYLEQLDREIAAIGNLDVSKYTSSQRDILTGTILIGTWSLLYDRGGPYQLDETGEAKRQEYKRLVQTAQARMFPAMRDAYGPVVRRKLWEADGTARTTGSGFRTMTTTLPAFVRNANIKQAHQDWREMLLLLRFTRAEYKWSQHSEYTYYTLTPPADTELGRWNAGGTFIPFD